MQTKNLENVIKNNSYKDCDYDIKVTLTANYDTQYDYTKQSS